MDHRADIFSLGVVLYELLVGELPLGRFDLPSQKAAVDSRVDEVVLRALARDPVKRYQHAGEMRAAIEDASHGNRPKERWHQRLVAAPTGSERQALETARWAIVSPERELDDRTDSDRARRQKEMIRFRVQRLATWLNVSGTLAFVYGILCVLIPIIVILDRQFTSGSDSELGVPLLLLFLAGLIGLGQGVALLRGGRETKRLGSYGLALASSIVAMVPLSPAFVIGLPVGIWGLEVLRGPDVLGAFQAQKATGSPRSQAQS